MIEKRCLSVYEFCQYTQKAVRRTAFFQNLLIAGEISNFKAYASGHWYFTLKDENAQISCVMFRGQNRSLNFVPENGLAVELAASADFYVKGGQFQLVVRELRRAGLGKLYEAFEALKVRLKAEGLFDPARKKDLPLLPRRIGVVTSPSGAVIRDIIHVLSRRYPNFDLLLSPCQVQGEKAAQTMIDALERLKTVPDVDLVIIGRGGGSYEDLWCFNDEALARAIVAYPIPTLSAVGHETDFTICDFVADLRAPTPSAAAELAMPVKADLLESLRRSATRSQMAIGRILDGRRRELERCASVCSAEAARKSLRERRQRLQLWASRPALRDPMFLLREAGQGLDQLGERLQVSRTQWLERPQALLEQLAERLLRAEGEFLNRSRQNVIRQAARLDALSPLGVLKRGYGMLLPMDSERPIVGIENLRKAQRFRLALADGEADCRVEAVHMKALPQSGAIAAGMETDSDGRSRSGGEGTKQDAE